MSTRISDPTNRFRSIHATILIPLALAACGQERTADTNVLAQVEADQRSAAADAGRIPCARGDAPLAADCTIEQSAGETGLMLTLRHPDGGFRRLLVTKDGRGVVAADGAEKAKVSILDKGSIEVSVAGERYRLPATVKSDRPAS